MPTTPLRNAVYRAMLPVLAPSPRGQMTHTFSDAPLARLTGYERLLCRHHVMGATLLLSGGGQTRVVYTSTRRPAHPAAPETMFRVASITKMATALVALTLCDEGFFALDSLVAPLLPVQADALPGVTVRHLLCHLSGLRDTPAVDEALRTGQSLADVLASPGVIAGKPGERFAYCNFGFGLLGCLFEQVTGQPLEEVFRARLFAPLGMRATLDGSTLAKQSVMPISRVLPYRPGHDVTVPALGRRPLSAVDPAHRFGHTAGALYTDAPSLSALLTLIFSGGVWKGKRLVSERLIQEMTTQQSFSGQADNPERRYGLGLVILQRPDLSSSRILGHQGFAYGCVDGAFYEEGTGRQVIFLCGGASEARQGRLGLCNRDLLHWALKEEIPSWT